MVKSIGISKRASGDRSQRNALGMLTLGSLIWQGINTLAVILLFGAFIGLAQQEPPAMVQLEGGKTIAIAPMNSADRTPAAIQRFTQDTMSLLLSSTGQFPSVNGEAPVRDPGVDIQVEGEVRKISSLARLASFGLSEDFRSGFLQELAKRVPDDVFGQQSRTQVVLVVQDISEPQLVERGQWKVTMIANLVEFTSAHPEGIPTPFNKEIFVRSITPPSVGEYSSDLEKQIAQVRQAGLEIYAIRNYVNPNL